MKATQPLTPLRDEVRSALSNPEAARHLGLQPNTLRIWACRGTGPIRPFKVGGRLRWRTEDIRRLLGDA